MNNPSTDVVVNYAPAEESDEVVDHYESLW